MSLPLHSPTLARKLSDLPAARFERGAGFDPASMHQALEAWAAELGPLYRFRLLGRRVLVASDPAIVAALLRDRPGIMRRGATLTRELEEGGVRGVFTADGDDWRRQRKLVMRALTPEIVHRFFPVLAGLTDRLRLRWLAALRDGRPIDLLRDVKAYTMDVTIGLALGHDAGLLGQDDSPLQRDIALLFESLGRRIGTPAPYRAANDGDDDGAEAAALARVRAAVQALVAAARARLTADPLLRTRPANLLEALVAAADEPGSMLDEEHVAGNALTMVFAGEDTTSHAIAWLIHLLAGHPQAAARAAAEADAALDGAPAPRTHADLERLPYLEAAAHESMRLKPVVPIIGLEPSVDVEVGGYAVPAGTHIMCLVRGASGGEAAFAPERWLGNDDAAGLARTRFPFGGGPRFCPGRYLAMAEIKALAAMLLANFELAPAPDAPPVEERYRFTLMPSALPVMLRARPRAA